MAKGYLSSHHPSVLLKSIFFTTWSLRGLEVAVELVDKAEEASTNFPMEEFLARMAENGSELVVVHFMQQEPYAGGGPCGKR